MARTVEIGDRLGIDRFIIYLGFDRKLDPSTSEIRQANDDVLQALSHWNHRAYAFVYLNPNHLEFSLKELDRCVRDGPMVGVKLWVAKRCDAPEVDAIIERATKYQAVIFQHTWFKVGGNLGGESTPYDLVALARRHPNAKIICGHTGGDWELGIRAIRDTNSLSADLAGSDPTAGFTEMAVRELGAERVIFGSDAGGRSIASQLGKVMGADISEAERKLILGENLKRLLTPILKAKGFLK
jgi:predicted TIM-barrel fold metal-dependent hydrolase